jgi:hypothetical protein
MQPADGHMKTIKESSYICPCCKDSCDIVSFIYRIELLLDLQGSPASSVRPYLKLD